MKLICLIIALVGSAGANALSVSCTPAKTVEGVATDLDISWKTESFNSNSFLVEGVVSSAVVGKKLQSTSAVIDRGQQKEFDYILPLERKQEGEKTYFHMVVRRALLDTLSFNITYIEGDASCPSKQTNYNAKIT